MQALTHKLWAKEYVKSTYQADLTNIVQHSMCGLTNELLKPDSDPRKVIRLAEQLRIVARTRAQEGLIKEALVALKQAKGMAATCLSNIRSGADMRRTIGCKETAVAIYSPKSVHAAPGPDESKGMRSTEHRANELLICITCDIVELASKPAVPEPLIKRTAREKSDMVSARSAMGTSRLRTDRSGAMSALLIGSPVITIFPELPFGKSLPWAGTSTSRSMAMKEKNDKKSAGERDWLCGQIASSPIVGYEDSDRYMTSTKKAYLMASNDELRKQNQTLRVTRRGTSWTPLPSERPPISDMPNDLEIHKTRQNLARQISDTNANPTMSVSFPTSRSKLTIEQGLGNLKTRPIEMVRANVRLPESVVKKEDGW